MKTIYETDDFESKLDWVLLVDADSMPDIYNNAIGKYITHFEAKNYGVRVLKLKLSAYPNKKKKIIIDASYYSAVRISIIFKRNKEMVEISNCKDVIFGGTGYDIEKKLPDEIDNLDATPYGVGKERIEFLTRGCIRDCWYCVVRQKEGYLYEYRDIDRVLSTYNGEQIRFFDNNFLAWEKANEVMEILIKKNIPCSFNEGLDIRLVNDQNADLLSRLNHYPTEYLFAFDDINSKSIIEEKLKILKKYIKKDWKLKFYVFTDADQPTSEVIDRIHWLRDRMILPYIMRYDNCYTSVKKDFYTDLSAWCNQPAQFKKRSFEEFIYKRHIKKKDRADLSFSIYKAEVFNLMASEPKLADPQESEIKIKKSTLEIGNFRYTLDGRFQVRTIITRSIGRGAEPDKLVTHKQKWKSVTYHIPGHPRGDKRKIVDLLMDMIEKDMDNLDFPEPFVTPIILDDEDLKLLQIEERAPGPPEPSPLGQFKPKLPDRESRIPDHLKEAVSTAPGPTDIDLYEKIKNDENLQCPVTECDEFDDCEINSTEPVSGPSPAPKQIKKRKSKKSDLDSLLSRTRKIRREIEYESKARQKRYTY